MDKHAATYTEKQSVLRQAIEHAPPASAPHKELAGWWLPLQDGDGFLCETCAGRIMARGVGISPAEPAYRFGAVARGVCMVCDA